MKEADLFILTSNSEGFPYVTIESMVCGTPVISTDCLSGPKTIISNNEYGILVPPSNLISLTRAIQYLLKNNQKRNYLSRVGLIKSKEYEIKKIIKKLETIFNDLFLRRI